MARKNVTATGPTVRTAGGSLAVHLTPLNELRRSVLTALLWEKTFYESGQMRASRIAELVPLCKPEDVAALAVEAREQMYLRHMPLYLVRLLAKQRGNGRLVAETLPRVIQRADELSEYLAIYWEGKASGTTKRPEPLSAGSKRGLAAAFKKFGPPASARSLPCRFYAFSRGCDGGFYVTERS